MHHHFEYSYVSHDEAATLLDFSFTKGTSQKKRKDREEEVEDDAEDETDSDRAPRLLQTRSRVPAVRPPLNLPIPLQNVPKAGRKEGCSKMSGPRNGRGCSGTTLVECCAISV